MKINYSKVLIILLITILYTESVFSQPFENDGGVLGGNAVPFLPPGGLNGYVILTGNDTIKGKISSKKINGMQFITQITFMGEGDSNVDYSADAILGFGFVAWDDKKNRRLKTYMSAEESEKYSYPVKWVNYESRPIGKKGKKVFIYRVLSGGYTIFQDPMSGYGYSRGSNSSLILQDKNAPQPPAKYQKFIAQPPDTKLWNLDDPEFVYFLDKYSYKVTLNGPGWSFGSYYFDFGDGQLIKIKNKNYEDYWSQLFGECAVINDLITEDEQKKKFAYYMELYKVYQSSCI